jgi:hypothetical protein
MHAFCGQRRFDFAGPFVTVHVKMCSMLVVGVVFIANSCSIICRTFGKENKLELMMMLLVQSHMSVPYE